MIREFTMNFRHQLGFGLMAIVAPKLSQDLQQYYTTKSNYLPRPFTQFLKKTYKDKPLMGCEIGYGYGANAESLLTELNIQQLYCVDANFAKRPYFDTGVVVDRFAKPNKQFYNRKARLSNSGKVTFIEAYSDNAFLEEMIPKNLDFIYIDGNHTYENCYNDIFNAMMFVKPGGYVGGHDFANGPLIGVAQAVFNYCKKYNIQPEMVYPDFWIQRFLINESQKKVET